MNDYNVTFYSLSDCTHTVTVTANSEAEARELVMQRGDVEMIVSVAQTSTRCEHINIEPYETDNSRVVDGAPEIDVIARYHCLDCGKVWTPAKIQPEELPF